MVYTHIAVNSQELFYEALQTIPAVPHHNYISVVSLLAEGIKPPCCEHDVERYLVDCSENRVLPYSVLHLNDAETRLNYKGRLFNIAIQDNSWPDADFYFDEALIGENIGKAEIPQSIEDCSDLASVIGNSNKVHRIDVRFKPALKEFQKSLLNNLRDNGYQINTANLIFLYSRCFDYRGELILRQEDVTFNRRRVPLLEKGLDFNSELGTGLLMDSAYTDRLDRWFEALKKKYES